MFKKFYEAAKEEISNSFDNLLVASDLCTFPKYVQTNNPDRRSRLIAQ